MKKHDPILLAGLLVLSVLTSFALVYYGMTVIMAGQTAGSQAIFAYVTTAYGLANIAILSLAWSSREAWSRVAHKFVALCFLGVFIMDTVMAGAAGVQEIAGILVLALVLWCNGLAVNKVVDRPRS